MATQGSSAAAATLQKRVKALLASTADLDRNFLSSPSTLSTASLFTDRSVAIHVQLEELVKSAEKCATLREMVDAASTQVTGTKIEFPELDMEGTRLWNMAATLVREPIPGTSGAGGIGGKKDMEYGKGNAEEKMKRILLQVRILAYYMLESAEASDTRRMTNTLRLFRIAIRASKLCIEQHELRWAEKVIGGAAKHQGVITKTEDASLTDDPQVVQLVCEYFILRTTLAWEQSSLTMAKYMFNKAVESDRYLANPRLTERMTEAVLDIGADLFINGSYPAAERWLQRSFDLINKVDPAYLSESGTELRMVISHKLARCCIKVATPECFTKAHNIIDMMIDDWPARISVSLLKLDLVLAETPNDVDAYAEVLMSMIVAAQLSATAFKAILGRMHTLLKKSPLKACECLDTLISKRLLKSDKQEWLEQTFVTRLWFIIQSQAYDADGDSALAKLKDLLDTMARQLQKPLSAKATHAAQILLWKVSDMLYSKQEYATAGSWCRVALHMVFDKSGGMNHAKIARRIIQCCILTKDYGTAAEVFNAMSEAAQGAPISKFLMYKVALRTSDDDLASSCLQSICENVSTDRRLLYACALDAQDVGNRRLALKTLHMISVKTESFPEDAVHVPSLLRCTIRLITSEVEMVQNSSSLVENLCQIYEKVLIHATRSRQKNRIAGCRDEVFNTTELVWFSRNGYNLGLRGIIEWPPKQTLRIWASCNGLLTLCAEDLPTVELAENLYRQIMCDFLCASLCIELARQDDSVEAQLQHYLKARNYISAFRSRLPEVQGRSEAETVDLQQRFTVLLGYDFEAVVRLKSWNDLLPLVDEATTAKIDGASTVLEIMAHIILSSDAQIKTTFTVMQRLLEKMMRTRGKKLGTIAKLIRHVIQIAMVKDFDFATEMLSQAAELTRNAESENPYPAEELEWLIAKTWNKSIDFVITADTENAKKFRTLALTLAGLLNDKSTLKHLQNKLLEQEAIQTT